MAADMVQRQQQTTRQQQQQQQHKQEQQFQELLGQLKQLPFVELQRLQAESAPPEGLHPAFSASFLFWLSGKEKAALGPRKQELASLAAQLVHIKMQAEFEASRRQLPPLATSLAYANYSQWKGSHAGEELPDVAPGISLTDFYKAAEREEAKLRQWVEPQQRPASSLDSFAATSGYQQAAADAMARARARLMGYEDDDAPLQQEQQTAPTGHAPLQAQQQLQVSPAAVRVLEELLVACCCREERATLLPEACVPPGLEVSATCSSSSGGAKARVVTAPQRLLEAIAARLQCLQDGAASMPTSPPQLPSGEGEAQALLQLREDVQEYDVHVYSRMSQRDLQGM